MWFIFSRQEGNTVCLKIMHISHPFYLPHPFLHKDTSVNCGFQWSQWGTSPYQRWNFSRPAWFSFGFSTFKSTGQISFERQDAFRQCALFKWQVQSTGCVQRRQTGHTMVHKLWNFVCQEDLPEKWETTRNLLFKTNFQWYIGDGCEYLTWYTSFSLPRARRKKVDTKKLISVSKESSVWGRLILERGRHANSWCSFSLHLCLKYICYCFMGLNTGSKLRFLHSCPWWSCP